MSSTWGAGSGRSVARVGSWVPGHFLHPEPTPRLSFLLLAQAEKHEAGQSLRGGAQEKERPAGVCGLVLPVKQGLEPAFLPLPFLLPSTRDQARHWCQRQPSSLLAPDQLWARALRQPQLCGPGLALTGSDANPIGTVGMVKGSETITFHHI